MEAGDALELVISRHPPLAPAGDDEEEPPKPLLFPSEGRINSIAL